MADNKDLAYQDYLNGMKYKDIAEKYGVTLNTVKSWKTRYKWSRDDVHTKDKGVHTKKRGAPKGNKNAVGNDGGAPKGNNNAVTHGLFSKYIPKETLELMGMLGEKSPADLIWDQIMIQYAAIIRSQQIMHVEDKNEIIKELKKLKVEASQDKNGNLIQVPIEKEYEFQFAWDRQATLLNAQSRAMSELRNLIKQFNDLAHDDDERKLKLQLMQANIKKAEAEVAKISKENTEEELEEIVIIDEWSDSDE